MNRPKIKVIEYEYKNIYGDFEYYVEGKKPMAQTTKPTGKTREIERPMFNEEYIAHLEQKNDHLEIDQEKLKDLLNSIIDNSKNQQAKFLEIVKRVIWNHFHCGGNGKKISDLGIKMMDEIIQEIEKEMEKNE